jgi:hypothetical protein
VTAAPLQGCATIVDGETISTELKTAFQPRLLPLHPASHGGLSYASNYNSLWP